MIWVFHVFAEARDRNETAFKVRWHFPESLPPRKLAGRRREVSTRQPGDSERDGVDADVEITKSFLESLQGVELLIRCELPSSRSERNRE